MILEQFPGTALATLTDMNVSYLMILRCFKAPSHVTLSSSSSRALLRSVRTLQDVRESQREVTLDQGDEKVFEIQYDVEIERLIRSGTRALDLQPARLIGSARLGARSAERSGLSALA